MEKNGEYQKKKKLFINNIFIEEFFLRESKNKSWINIIVLQREKRGFQIT
jgi:hypothetical protein